MKRTNWGVYTGAILVAAVLAATPMAGQWSGERHADAVRHADDYQQRLEKASKLEALAEEAARDLQTFAEAARLYRKAAEVRGHSPESVQNRILAAHLDYYLGDRSDAADGLAGAAETAKSWDDVRTAAHAFLDAAWVALEDGHARQARRLALEAERLSHSPLMAAEEQQRVQDRIADLDL